MTYELAELVNYIADVTGIPEREAFLSVLAAGSVVAGALLVFLAMGCALLGNIGTTRTRTQTIRQHCHECALLRRQDRDERIKSLGRFLAMRPVRRWVSRTMYRWETRHSRRTGRINEGVYRHDDDYLEVKVSDDETRVSIGKTEWHFYPSGDYMASGGRTPRPEQSAQQGSRCDEEERGT